METPSASDKPKSVSFNKPMSWKEVAIVKETLAIFYTVTKVTQQLEDGSKRTITTGTISKSFEAPAKEHSKNKDIRTPNPQK